jgi:hypothetical protein
MNTRDTKALAFTSLLQSATIFLLLGVTFCSGCATTRGTYASELERKIAAARTAAVIFRLAVSEAETRCEHEPSPLPRESPCTALPSARAALARLEQAIVLADANKGSLADALTAIEQLAQVVDMARRPE